VASPTDGATAAPGVFSLRPIIRVGLACGGIVNRLVRAFALLEPVGFAVLRK